jgi:hypothetical protein
MKRRRVCQCGCPPSQHFEKYDDGSGCINCKSCDHYVEETPADPMPEEMFGGAR